MFGRHFFGNRMFGGHYFGHNGRTVSTPAERIVTVLAVTRSDDVPTVSRDATVLSVERSVTVAASDRTEDA